jgi:hypothetical protein
MKTRTEETAIVVAPQQPTSDAGQLMQIIANAAQDPAYDPAKLSALLDVKSRWEADEARKAFVVAMADFKNHAPTILKNKQVSFSQTKYKHATLDNVCDILIPALSKVGISHRWDVKQANGLIEVTCILTHVLGHSERTSMTGEPDKSGSKNPIQSIASATTYLQRYTFLAATGMAVRDTDNDGAGAPDPFITKEQQAELHAALTAAKRDIPAFLKLHEIDALDELPQSKFREFMQAIRLMRDTAAKKEAVK